MLGTNSHWMIFSLKCNSGKYDTAWKVSKYGVISGPYFPVFGLNTEVYSVNLHIQSEYRKIWTRKTSIFGHFSRSASNRNACVCSSFTVMIILFKTSAISSTLYSTLKVKVTIMKKTCFEFYFRKSYFGKVDVFESSFKYIYIFLVI